MIATDIFAIALGTVGVALLIWHALSWNAEGSHVADPQEHAFLRRQLIRRLETSTLICVLGGAMWAGKWIPESVGGLLYWITVMLVVFWIGVLALADVLAIGNHYGAQHKANQRKQAELQVELQRIQQSSTDQTGD